MLLYRDVTYRIVLMCMISFEKLCKEITLDYIEARRFDFTENARIVKSCTEIGTYSDDELNKQVCSKVDYKKVAEIAEDYPELLN